MKLLLIPLTLIALLIVTSNPTKENTINVDKVGTNIETIFEQEMAFYEDSYNMTFVPVNIYSVSQEESINKSKADNDTAGYYHVGGGLVWTNASGALYDEYQAAKIYMITNEERKRYELRHIIRHELCHHYLQSHCLYSDTYGDYIDFTSGIKVFYPNDKEKLPSDIEEPICEGFAMVSLNDGYNVANKMYHKYEKKPRAFFDCIFETCNVDSCLDKY